MEYWITKYSRLCQVRGTNPLFRSTEQSLETEGKNIAPDYRTSKVPVVTKHHALECIAGKVTVLMRWRELMNRLKTNGKWQIYTPLALALTKFHILPYDVFARHVIKLLIQQSTRPVIAREFHCLFTGQLAWRNLHILRPAISMQDNLFFLCPERNGEVVLKQTASACVSSGPPDFHPWNLVPFLWRPPNDLPRLSTSVLTNHSNFCCQQSSKFYRRLHATAIRRTSGRGLGFLLTTWCSSPQTPTRNIVKHNQRSGMLGHGV